MFDLGREAVSILRGGVAAKPSAWRTKYKGSGKGHNGRKPRALLAVEDPQQYGKDISQGSYNIERVLSTFSWAGGLLSGEDMDGEGEEGGGGRQQKQSRKQQQVGWRE